MRNLMKTLAVVAVMLVASLSAHAQKKADDILGVWWNTEKTSKIEVYKTGDKYYGKIIHLVEPNDDKGKPKVDKDNPDAKLKSRPLQGLVILKSLKYDGDGEYESGLVIE